MGKMNVALSNTTEEKFRRAVFETIGMKKGNISLALEEAIEMWIEDAARKKKAKAKQAAEERS